MVQVEENRVWTKDVQPKDPAHWRISDEKNAAFLMQSALGQAGTVGSQFPISDILTLQIIDKDQRIVAPLDYAGLFVWAFSGKDIPGYMVADAENPTAQAEFKPFEPGKEMKYSPGAYFNYNLERHLRNHGYLNKGLTDYTFEIDDSGHEWWIVTVYEPTIAWTGEKVLGVAIVNPVNGEIDYKKMGEIPAWVDRAIPISYMKKYLEWKGMYSGGWLNSWATGNSLTKPEKPILVYGADDQPLFVAGITSTSDKDTSLVKMAYMNSRTGKLVIYEMKGGATETAVLSVVNENGFVKQQHLHGTTPQIYNVNGVPTSIVPLFNDANAYQGVALVNIFTKQVAVGPNQHDALRVYEKLLTGEGSRSATGNETKKKIIEGIVSRTGVEVLANAGSIYYFKVGEIPQLFTIGAGTYPVVVVTEKGDKIRIEVYETEKDVAEISVFENLTVPLGRSNVQKQVQNSVDSVSNKAETKRDAAAIRERIKNMNDEQLKQLEKQIPAK